MKKPEKSDESQLFGTRGSDYLRLDRCVKIIHARLT